MARLLNMLPDDQVEPHLAAHLEHLRRLNHSPQSQRERRLTILRLVRHFRHPVAEVTKDELRAWQDQRSRQIEPASMHNEIGHISMYMKWLNGEELREDNPTAVLDRPRHDRQGIPTPMPDAEVTRALETAAHPDVHAWIGLGAFCGLRCMEMAKVTAEDIIRAASQLRIIGKGGHERVVPLPAVLLAELTGDRYPIAGHLFARLDGRPGPPSAARVSERVNDHLHSVGIALTAHKLRHRFGTKLYEATGDPFLVQQIMGHKSADTTKGYVQLANSKAAAAIEAISHLAA